MTELVKLANVFGILAGLGEDTAAGTGQRSPGVSSHGRGEVEMDTLRY